MYAAPFGSTIQNVGTTRIRDNNSGTEVIPLVSVLAACEARGSAVAIAATAAAGPTKKASRRQIMPSLETRFGMDASETTVGENKRIIKHHRVKGVMKLIMGTNHGGGNEVA
jgi:hypothetical protein